MDYLYLLGGIFLEESKHLRFEIIKMRRAPERAKEREIQMR